MALIWMDGFDEYTSASDAAFTSVYSPFNSPGFSTSGGRYSGGAVTIGGTGFGYNLPSSQTEIWMGFAIANTSSASDSYVRQLIAFNSASGTECAIYYQCSTNEFIVERGGTTLGSGIKSIGVSPTYHWIDVHYKLNSSSGTVEVWVDGTQVVNLTGVNTTNNGVSSFTQVEIGTTSGGPAGVGAYIDDLYILNTTGGGNTSRLGDSRIETLKPNSDASPNNGTPSSGTSHYAMVSENQNDGSSTYITIANTSGQEELFGMGSLSGTPATVYAVKVTNIAEKTDAGSCSGESVVSSSGVAATGSSTALLTTFGVVDGLFETDPNTSSAWAYTAVNAMKCGFKIP